MSSINGWQIDFDSNYGGYIIGVTKRIDGWTVAFRRNGVYVSRRHQKEYYHFETKYNNLPQLFAETLSGQEESKNKLKKELTKLNKLGKLIGIDIK